jgi:hypothetical protein
MKLDTIILLTLVHAIHAACPMGFLGRRDSSHPPVKPVKRSVTISERSANWNPYYTTGMQPADWDTLRNDISVLIRAGNGPVLIRLAW